MQEMTKKKKKKQPFNKKVVYLVAKMEPNSYFWFVSHV